MMHLDWIDRYKGFLIILVVMGHVVGGAYHIAQEVAQPFLHYAYLTIYAFHMPAFFFVAGITWRIKDGETFGAFVVKKAKRLLVPYAIFGLASTVVYCLMVADVQTTLQGAQTTNYYQDKFAGRWLECLIGLLHAGGYPNGEGFRMNSVLWFLPCMFTTEVIYYVIEKSRWLGRFGFAVVILCVALAIGLPRIGLESPWGVACAPHYLLFMMLGRVWGKGEWTISGMRMGMRSAALLAGSMAFATVVWALPNPWIQVEQWPWRVVYMALAAIGCVLFAEIAKVLEGRWLAACGMASMGIMLMHKFFVVGFELKVGPFRRLIGSGLSGAIVGCLIIGAVSTAVCYVLTRIIQKNSKWMLGE